MMKIIDISQEVFSGRVYPGDRSPSRKQVKTIARDHYNLSDIHLCVHNGTHIDAPRHFLAAGQTVDQLPLELFYGTCTVAQFSGMINERSITPVLAVCHERLLLQGDCEISDGAAQALADSQVKLVGVESQSVGNPDAPLSVHLTLLAADVILLEGLRLSDVAPGEYMLAAFPLKLADTEGSPVRAVLIELPEGRCATK
ncbi:MAG: cyclase family protein [Peptococcaceae bacterium]|jgi:arylformamidase|nr:cyclase family protein [Peptococcaceae bacterium]